MRLLGNNWLEEKHKTKRKRRSWRKLYLGLDLVSGEIVCSDLTKDDVGDTTALPDLLDQVDGPVDLFLADGAYDGEPTSDLLAARFGSMIEITIPLPKMQYRAPMQLNFRRRETAISPRSKARGEWLGRKPLATINAAEVKPSWGVGRRLSGPS